MKVYIIFRGEYSDTYVDFVTENEKVAKEYCELYSSLSYGAPYYEEYDTDVYTIEDVNDEKEKRCPTWHIQFGYDKYDGWVIWYKNFDINFSGEKINTITNSSGMYNVYIYGYEEDDWIKVKKIARDMLMEQLAKDNNLV